MKQKLDYNPVLFRILITLRLRSLKQRDLTNYLGIADVAFSKWKSRGSTAYTRYIIGDIFFLTQKKDAVADE